MLSIADCIVGHLFLLPMTRRCSCDVPAVPAVIIIGVCLAGQLCLSPVTPAILIIVDSFVRQLFLFPATPALISVADSEVRLLSGVPVIPAVILITDAVRLRHLSVAGYSGDAMPMLAFPVLCRLLRLGSISPTVPLANCLALCRLRFRCSSPTALSATFFAP